MIDRAEPSWIGRLSASEAAMTHDASPPAFRAPMTAVTGRCLFSDPDWLFQPLVSGQRAMAYRVGRKAYLYDQRRSALSQRYPQIVDTLRRQPCDEFLLDGVIVCARPRTGQSAKKTRFIAFDIVYCDGYSLEALPLLTRHKILQDTLHTGASLALLPSIREHGERYFARARATGYRGIIAKDIDSLYVCGPSTLWRKFPARNFGMGETQRVAL